MKAKPMTGGGGAKAFPKKKMQNVPYSAKNETIKKSPTMKPKPDGGKKKPAVSKTGARVFSAYGPSEEVGNPGAGVSRRKVVSDYIRGAKPAKKK